MPQESSVSRWGILRIFMRNLVNRSHSPMPAEDMLCLLNAIEASAESFAQRCMLLAARVNQNRRLAESLAAFVDPQKAPCRAPTYIDWICSRLVFYAQLPVDRIDAGAVLSDLEQIAKDPRSKIPNMGIALAANFLADLGVRSVAKPDLHVLPSMRGFLDRALKPEACVKAVIRAAQQEAPQVKEMLRFNWLTGGLYPRDLDRIIYLIGSDNFLLDGTKKRRPAPIRRKLVLEALLHP